MEAPTPDDAFGFFRSFLAHRAHVAEGLRVVVAALEARSHIHDLSKLSDDEFGSYCRINAGVRAGAKHGTPEYSALIDSERENVNAHFARNRHHPEHIPEACRAAGLLATSERMSFIDVIEMVVDWRAAWKGYGDARPWLDAFNSNVGAKKKYLTEAQLWLAGEVAALLGGGAS